MPIDALSVLCAQLTRDLLEIAKFLVTEMWWFSEFQNDGRSPSWICYDVTILHRRTHIRCPSIVLKCYVDRFCSFRDTCNIVCGNFGVAHALYHVTLSREVQNNHSYEVFDPYLPIHYATFMRLRWRLRGSKVSIPIVKRFLGENFLSPVKNGPQNGAISGKWGSRY